MSRVVRFSRWQAALWSGVLLAGCAPQADYSGVTTSPIAMVCDGGRTFTLAYANNFETAVIEAEGQRLELPRVYTALSMTPTPPEFGSGSVAPMFDTTERRGFGQREDFGRLPGGASAAGATGVRYGTDEALFISRNQGAVLQVGDSNYSNCEVARA